MWVNGEQVYNFGDRRGFSHDSGRFDVTLKAGTNRVMIRCGNRGGPWQFSLAVTALADYAFLKAPVRDAFDPDLYRAVALKGQGSASHGRRLFADLKGLACVKCHAVGKEGGTVGPELTTVGAKYPRDELIASVLYPSAKISSGFEPTTLRWSTAAWSAVLSVARPTARSRFGLGCQIDQARQGPDRRPQARRRLGHADRPGHGPLPGRLRRLDRLS